MMNRSLLATLSFSVLTAAVVSGHPLASGDEPVDREVLRQHILEEWMQQQADSCTQRESASHVRTVSTAASVQIAAVVQPATHAPATAKPFLSFPRLQLTWDKDFLRVGSNGLPDHKMMVGITAWQQQVPLPQAYVGDNAWHLPLNPVPAKTPAMIKGRFLRGAIALAVNGIPIFNPQNNRGEISAEIGELDQWGGHCGRADDYHYHLVPLHLQPAVGKGMPLAYALDGYPVYGLTEPDGSPVGELDVCHGHELPGIGYHYHASKKYPYVIGGFHGEVTEAGGQVDPQPRAQPVRQVLPPMRGAEITGFESTGANSYALRYTVGGVTRSISYAISADGTRAFEFDNGSGSTTREVYPANRGPGARRAPGELRPSGEQPRDTR